MRICQNCQEVNAGPGKCIRCGTDLEEGTLVSRFADKYELDTERRLGGGGFGTVYECISTKPSRERYAVKLIDLDTAEDEKERDILRLSFIRESRVLARMDHPNVIRLVDFGIYDASRLFLVTELLPGTVHTLLARGDDLGLSRITQIGLELASALEHIHGVEDGFIHRDLKPSNVGLDEMGRVRLLDFGVVKIFGQAFADRQGGVSSRRESFVFAGSMAYGGVEQFGFGDVGPWSDVHAFGGVLYHMIARRPPRQGADIPMLLQLEPPDPLPDDPDRPDELDALITACLQPRSGDRPQNMQWVRERLEYVTELVQIGAPTIDAERQAVAKERHALQTERNFLASMRAEGETVRAERDEATGAHREAERRAEDAESRASRVHLEVLELERALDEARQAQAILTRRGRDLGMASLFLFAAIVVGSMAWWFDREPRNAIPVATVDAPERSKPRVAVSEVPPAPVEPPAPESPQAGPSVSIRSKPSDAEVIDVSTGAVLGRTPITIDLDPDETSRQVRIRRRGHTEQVVEIGPDEATVVTLDPVRKPRRRTRKAERRATPQVPEKELIPW